MSNKRRSEKKVTVWLPTDLLDAALASGAGNITETVKRALTMMAASAAYDKMVSLRGKVKLSVDVKSLREDRR